MIKKIKRTLITTFVIAIIFLILKLTNNISLEGDEVGFSNLIVFIFLSVLALASAIYIDIDKSKGINKIAAERSEKGTQSMEIEKALNTPSTGVIAASIGVVNAVSRTPSIIIGIIINLSLTLLCLSQIPRLWNEVQKDLDALEGVIGLYFFSAFFGILLISFIKKLIKKIKGKK